MKKKSAIKTQTLTTIIIAAVTLALIIMYFAVLSPILNSEAEQDTAPKLLSGESLGTDNRIYMYEYLNSDTINSVSVTNKDSSYSISRADDNNVYIDGNKNAPYETAMFSSLCVAVGYSLSMERIVPAPDDGNEPQNIDYANYGLDEKSATAHYSVTSKDGNTYTVWIGSKIASDQGYYARLEGRNAVYIIGTDIETTVLSPLESIITPMLALPTSSESYYELDYFTLWKGGSHFITIHYLSTDAELNKYASETKYMMAHDQNVSSFDVTSAENTDALKEYVGTDKLDYEYTPVIDEYATVLENFVSFKGTKTVKVIEPAKENATEAESDAYATKVSAALAEYGINPVTPAYELFFNYNGVNSYVIFSEKNSDGNFYAYSYAFGIIAEVSSDTLDFLDWSFAQWVEPSFFQKNIKNIDSISVTGNGNEYDFALTHEPIEGSQNENLTVKDTVSEKTIDTQNFRQFFKVLLTRQIRGELGATEPDENALYATLTVKTTSGITTEYRFYQASTQKTYMTVNGDGQFYVLTSSVSKMLSDAQKLIDGETVASEELE